MKKVSLILNIAFWTSVMMNSFVVNSQTIVNNTNMIDEKESDIEEQRGLEVADSWDEFYLAQEFETIIHTLSPSNSGGTIADKPLRFVLMIGMTELPDDKVNSMCYSNIITHPGPPGWGEKGFLPIGSMEQARKIIEGYKQQFFTACERSGRKITREGNFSYVWNLYEGEEEKVSNAKAKYPSDVSVTLQ